MGDELSKREVVFVIPQVEPPDEVEIRAAYKDGKLQLWLNGVEIEGVREVVLNGVTYGSGPGIVIRALQTAPGKIQGEQIWRFSDVPEFQFSAKGVSDAK